MEGLTHDEAVKTLQRTKDTVTLVVARLPLDSLEALAEVSVVIGYR